MKKLNRNENTMPPLVPEEEDAPQRTGSGAKWVTFVCILLAAALIIASLPSGISATTRVNDKVFSAVPEENVISTPRRARPRAFPRLWSCRPTM